MELLTAPHKHLKVLERRSTELNVHPVMRLSPPVQVLDLSTLDAAFPEEGSATIGRYDELRPGLYQSALFTSQGAPPRCVHVGVDLGSPAGAPVYAWADSELFAQGALPAPGDYGHSVILKTELTLGSELVTLWSLYGHLSEGSLSLHAVGDRVQRGAQIGELGASHENGGWPPHLHFQLSWLPPHTHDMPGVVPQAQRQHATWTFPDPRVVLGPLY